jgi:DNA primase
LEKRLGRHAVEIREVRIERVLIAYDRDDAGDRAAERLAARLIAERIECWRIQFPKGMDANDYALKLAPAAKSLELAIRKALWMGKGGQPVPAAPEAVSVEPAAYTEPTPSACKEESVEPLAASPVPAPPAPEPAAEVKDAEVVFRFGEGEPARRYRVRGLGKNASHELLKVNLLAAAGEAFYVDTLDLYAARSRASYITQAAVELKLAEEIVKADLGRVLMQLEALQEERIRKALEPAPAEGVRMTPDEREAALALLRSPDLPARILADFETCGIVGERTNKLVGYLATVSRKLDNPLAVVIQSSSDLPRDPRAIGYLETAP